MDHPLPDVEIMKQCPASWWKMKGDAKVRHCEICNRNVFNLSGMSTEEAYQLLADTEGRLCVRFYRRPDGSVVTGDCSPWAKAKAWTRASAAGLLSILGVGGMAAFPVMGQARPTLESTIAQQDHVIAYLSDQLRSAESKDDVERIRQRMKAVASERKRLVQIAQKRQANEQ